ncbi:hypothetical protein ACHIPZ_13795 [Antrihabitans sp. NCIMB 15449]|uniref:Terminase small subunit n=1 Tax=Antrihabitans spumae TaxID=3373370 RepID=A0ABW7JNB9_9NOCA
MDEAGGLGPAGRRLFESLHDSADPYSLTAMVIEACRAKDRLDKLDLLLRGEIETWAVLVHDLRTKDYELKINSAAAESRQLVTAFRQLLTEIRRQKGEATEPDTDDGLADL